MTLKESKQKHGTFVNAGKKAFKLGVNISANPYKDQPFKGLWEKGHSAESFRSRFKTVRQRSEVR